MIITALLNLIYTVLSVLLVFELPQLPQTVTSLLSQITTYVGTGVSIIGIFIGSTALGILAVLLQLVIYMNAAYFLWSFVFWVIRKIPMLGVKE
ncbi:MAG: hypothetical protein MR393_11835 [Intestinimonas massiliensis]|jgi:mannose/fructose/N-acetylgalactosamine-specific phosphotransferase system component IIC|uniref:hypothetical protein n=1 Tax=Intestinimonas massiliensis (ex Afouda et al. 2020) TaxID=1673721 RepID=UPI0024321C5F|nr:hypothetical protein [Intestinimonas massiliensis (ex Afouda et al. 2020)]MCI5563801.1 hypothetical protein [Intestinimonas massiliensis (ex Afouda et al. 2020)]